MAHDDFLFLIVSSGLAGLNADSFCKVSHCTSSTSSELITNNVRVTAASSCSWSCYAVPGPGGSIHRCPEGRTSQISLHLVCESLDIYIFLRKLSVKWHCQSLQVTKEPSGLF